MATILELAQHSNLPVETVLRVVNGESVSSEARDRVAEAFAALGPPNYPRFAPPSNELVPAQESLVEALERALPSEVGEVVYEAVRVEVRPVGEHVAQLRSLFEEVAARLARERRERVDDVELMTELMIEGWRSVDRRLGRIEKVLARLEGPPAGAEEADQNGQRVVRMDDYHRAG
jgi:hypothetical protein